MMLRSNFLWLLLLACGCSSLKDAHKYQLTDGKYEFRQGGQTHKKTQVYFSEDSTKIFAASAGGSALKIDPLQEQIFLKRTFDVDVITVPFKFRPIAAGFPRQLSTDFNGNVFAGYRLDRFRLKKEQTPVGFKDRYFHSALSIGAFGGIGSSSINASTTGNAISDDYNGFVFSRGVAFMVGINNLTVGVGVGWDYLTDRDKNIWIYQNEVWYGLTLGLNLN